MNLEIGGGTTPTEGFINLDPVHGEGEWKRTAETLPWPIEDNSVDSIRASHVMEHIPAGWDFRVAVMNEAFRVLKPGGTFEIIVPLLISTTRQPCWQAVADPTHVSFWVRESFMYFDHTIAPNASYGISKWETVSYHVVDQWEAHWVGRKPYEAD